MCLCIITVYCIKGFFFFLIRSESYTSWCKDKYLGGNLKSCSLLKLESGFSLSITLLESVTLHNKNSCFWRMRVFILLTALCY